MKPNFTQEQKDFICWQIGEWYVGLKDHLVNYDERTHCLGRAKELLKLMVCDDVDEIGEIITKMRGLL